MSFDEKLSVLLRRRFQEPERELEIDREIWREYGREAAVIITDLTRCTAMTREKGILHFLSVVQCYCDLISPLVESHRGVIVKVEGDSLYLFFENSVDAVRFAMDSRTACDNYNLKVAEERRVNLCQGIAFGEILLLQGDLFGDAVNTASKLGEDTAGAREILISEEVFLEVEEVMAGTFFQRREAEFTGVNLAFYSVM